MTLLDVDWHGFGRTLGGFVDPWGRCAVPKLDEPTDELRAAGGIAAPVVPLYEFAAALPSRDVVWLDWLLWYPPWDPIELPVVRVSRGPVRYTLPET